MADHPFGNTWSASEIAFLREHYQTIGADAVAAKLGRSRVSVMHKAARIGVSTHRRWTANDDQHLRALWGTISLGHVAKTLKRTTDATYWRARRLGLPCGSTQGMEYLTAAATRTGFETTSLRRILRWGGVRLVPTSSRPTKARRRFHMVDPIDVDDAVERWLRTEIIEVAARDRGMSGDTLERWLREAGVGVSTVRPAGKGEKPHRRVETAVIDRVVAERSKLRSLSSEARRAGVDRSTLRKWLLADGVPRARRNWFVDPADVDRVVAARKRGKKAA